MNLDGADYSLVVDALQYNEFKTRISGLNLIVGDAGPWNDALLYQELKRRISYLNFNGADGDRMRMLYSLKNSKNNF